MKEMLIGAVVMYMIISIVSFIIYVKNDEYAAIPALIPEAIIGCFIWIIRFVKEQISARHELQSIFSFSDWYEKWLLMFYGPDQIDKARAFYPEDAAKEDLINSYNLDTLKKFNKYLKENEEKKD